MGELELFIVLIWLNLIESRFLLNFGLVLGVFLGLILSKLNVN